MKEMAKTDPKLLEASTNFEKCIENLLDKLQKKKILNGADAANEFNKEFEASVVAHLIDAKIPTEHVEVIKIYLDHVISKACNEYLKNGTT